VPVVGQQAPARQALAEVPRVSAVVPQVLAAVRPARVVARPVSAAPSLV